MDQPQGEIVWADQRTGTAWINLGRADGLASQTSFGVFAAGAKDMAKKKGTVEVTRILDEHAAETRITADKGPEPITPGDTVFTPLSAPTKQ